MLVFVNLLVATLYFGAMTSIMCHYTKTKLSIINEFNMGWMLFIMASVMLIIIGAELPGVIKADYDKSLKIGPEVTVKQLYDKGYVVVKKDTQENIYYVREITTHQTPIEEIK